MQNEHPLISVWYTYSDLVKSLIREDPLGIAVDALKWAHKLGNAEQVTKAIEILDFIVENSASQDE